MWIFCGDIILQLSDQEKIWSSFLQETHYTVFNVKQGWQSIITAKICMVLFHAAGKCLHSVADDGHN